MQPYPIFRKPLMINDLWDYVKRGLRAQKNPLPTAHRERVRVRMRVYFKVFCSLFMYL